MSAAFPSQAKVNPSFSEPDLIVTYAQASGWMYALENSRPRTKIGPDDLYAYVNHLDIRTNSVASQFGSNFLPSASLLVEYASTQTYLMRTREVLSDEMMRAAGRFSFSLPQAYELGMRQSIYQQMRTMGLYGITAANNEGLLNTQGATAVTLPADSYGITSVQDYDNGDMANFILAEISALKQSLYQSGGNIKNRIVIVSPQREFLNFQLADIVQLTAYQRPGGGSNTVAGTVQKVLEEAGDSIEWYYDDTLIGKGAGGSDMILMTIPEMEIPNMPILDTNTFGGMRPATTAVNVMYTDVAAPVKKQSPVPDDAYTMILEMRASCGWCWRPQGLTLISMPY